MASVTSDEAKEKYINQLIEGYKERSARLEGRKIRYFDSPDQKNKRWWGSCQAYTLIALFIIMMIGGIIAAISMGIIFFT